MRIELAPDVQPEGTRIPDAWIDVMGEGGDGRGRGGRDRVWIVADVVLAIKVSGTFLLDSNIEGKADTSLGWPMGPPRRMKPRISSWDLQIMLDLPLRGFLDAAQRCPEAKLRLWSSITPSASKPPTRKRLRRHTSSSCVLRTLMGFPGQHHATGRTERPEKGNFTLAASSNRSGWTGCKA